MADRQPSTNATGRWALCITLGVVTTCAVTILISLLGPVRGRHSDLYFPYTPSGASPALSLHTNWGPGVESRLWVSLDRPELANPQVRTSPAVDHRALINTSWGRLAATAKSAASHPGLIALDEARGWPFLAAWCEVTLPQSPGVVTANGIVGGVAVSPTDGTVQIQRFRCIPLRPIWTGALLDSAVFAACWVVPLIVWPMAKRRRRSRLGHCPACNYDLRGDLPSGCPECGWNRPGPSPKGAMGSEA